MSKIAIVGCDASGKTVLISSLSDYYKAGQTAGQPCIMVPANTPTRRYTDTLHRTMRINRAWPPATNDIAGGGTFVWSLMNGSERLGEIELMDFGGENFRYAFRDDGEVKNPEVVARLKAYIEGADFVIVTVGLDKMLRTLKPEVYRELADGDIEYDRDSEAQWVTQGLLKMVAPKLKSDPPAVVIALTQADKHREELKEYGSAKNLFAKGWPMIATVYPDIPVVAVASVDRTGADGLPGDGYRTDGVLPVMQAYARFAFGDCDALVREMDVLRAQVGDAASAKNSPEKMNSVARFRTLHAELKQRSLLVSALYADALKTAEDFLASFPAAEVKPFVPEKRPPVEKRSAPVEGKPAPKSPRKSWLGRGLKLGLIALFATALIVGAVYGVLLLTDAWRDWRQARQQAMAAEAAHKAAEVEATLKAAEAERKTAEAEAARKAAEAEAARKAAEVEAQLAEAARKAEEERLASERKLEEAARQLREEAEKRAAAEKAHAEELQRLEAVRRAEEERRRIEEEQRRAEEERRRAEEEEQRRVEAERQRAEEEKRVAEEKRRAAEEQKRAEKAKKAQREAEKSNRRAKDNDKAAFAKLFETKLAAAKLGDVDAMLWVGNRYYSPPNSAGVISNPVEAYVWYKKAAAKGSAQANYYLSLLLERGSGCVRNEPLSGRYCLQAARLGCAEAMYWTGVYFLEGSHGFETSASTACKYLEMARDAGFTHKNMPANLAAAASAKGEPTVDERYPQNPETPPKPMEKKSSLFGWF